MPRKLRYFDKFSTQNQIIKASLPEEFFDEWFGKLTFNFKDLRANAYTNMNSCTHHLLTHKDCPMKYRLLFMRSSYHVVRSAAMFANDINGSHIKYRFATEALSDKAKSIQNKFLLLFIYDFKHKRRPPKESLPHVLDFIRPRIIEFATRIHHSDPISMTFCEKVFIEALRISIQEGVSALLNPDLIVREVSAWIIENRLETEVTEFLDWEKSIPGWKLSLSSSSLEKLLD